MPTARARLLVLPILLAALALAAVTGIKASAATLSVSTGSLPTGEAGVPYAQIVTATGGTAPYTWAVNSGALPSGTNLDASSGAIIGTPAAAGIFNFSVQVTDSTAATALKALSITIQPAVSVSTASLAGGQVGLAYSDTLTASGGVSPFTWTVTVGGLPLGLALNPSTGAITGTPTTAGTTAFTVQVTDSLSQTATGALSITVSPSGTLMVTTGALPNGTVGVAYAQTLAASGGTTPYTWSVTAGALPAGLALNPSSGVISGTPSASGTLSFTVTVTDSVAATASKAFTLAISPLTVSTASLASGQVGAAYSQTLAATGGSTPYTWAITAGSLPAGLTLNTTSGAISGVPTTAGVSSFTMRVTDSASATATATLSIAVTPAATPTPTATATATATPADEGRHGLCNAYFRGSENGRNNKHAAPPFQALADDAERAGQSVEAFCGRAEATATPSTSSSDSQGSHGKGKSNNAGGRGRGR